MEGRRGRRDFPPKPVNIGEEYDVNITEVSRKGDGITRIKGLVIFVPNTKVGDKVHVKIVKLGRRYAIAEKI